VSWAGGFGGRRLEVGDGGGDRVADGRGYIYT